MTQTIRIAERRTELLERVVDVMLSEGISADLSLRPLAKAVGTSARLLIYHFGSKEKLLADALEQVRQRFVGSPCTTHYAQKMWVRTRREREASNRD